MKNSKNTEQVQLANEIFAVLINQAPTMNQQTHEKVVEIISNPISLTLHDIIFVAANVNGTIYDDEVYNKVLATYSTFGGGSYIDENQYPCIDGKPNSFPALTRDHVTLARLAARARRLFDTVIVDPADPGNAVHTVFIDTLYPEGITFEVLEKLFAEYIVSVHPETIVLSTANDFISEFFLVQQDIIKNIEVCAECTNESPVDDSPAISDGKLYFMDFGRPDKLEEGVKYEDNTPTILKDVLKELCPTPATTFEIGKPCDIKVLRDSELIYFNLCIDEVSPKGLTKSIDFIMVLDPEDSDFLYGSQYSAGTHSPKKMLNPLKKHNQIDPYIVKIVRYYTDIIKANRDTSSFLGITTPYLTYGSIRIIPEKNYPNLDAVDNFYEVTIIGGEEGYLCAGERAAVVRAFHYLAQDTEDSALVTIKLLSNDV